MQFDCHYPNMGSVTVSQGYLQNLESRLQAMERRVPGGPPSNGQGPGDLLPLESYSPYSNVLDSDIDIPVTVHEDSSPQVTDAMGSLGFINEEQTSYWGKVHRHRVND
jgi:hypothetical protein